MHTAQLRMELSQSKLEQREYLKNVELARVLEKRVEKKRARGEDMVLKARKQGDSPRKRIKPEEQQLDTVLQNVF